MNWLEYEEKAAAEGYKAVCGVDEAGRGPLAGPVCAAAVILPQGKIIAGVNDSKKLSEKKREALFEVIKAEALSYCIAYASVEEIESMNILNATMLAMKRAVEGLSVRADFAMIDGNRLPDLDIDAEHIIKGDARDRLLYQYAEEFPQYGFDKHKGYGTKVHREALMQYGPCKYHRLSFLGKIPVKR